MSAEKTSSFDNFNPETYLASIFPTPSDSGEIQSFASMVLKQLAKFYKETLSDVQSNTLQVLDYGSGPSLPFSISAASKASEIVLAEYAESNRDFLKRWVDNPATYNWAPYFEHVVQRLEGGSKDEALQREACFHTKIKAIVPCDIRKDDFLNNSNTDTQYDIVMTLAAMESGCRDLDEYKKGIKNLASLVKSGGHFIMCSICRENVNEGFYIVKGVKYPSLVLKRNFIIETLQSNGLTIIDEDYMPTEHTQDFYTNCEGVLFLIAKKN